MGLLECGGRNKSEISFQGASLAANLALPIFRHTRGGHLSPQAVFISMTSLLEFSASKSIRNWFYRSNSGRKPASAPRLHNLPQSPSLALCLRRDYPLRISTARSTAIQNTSNAFSAVLRKCWYCIPTSKRRFCIPAYREAWFAPLSFCRNEILIWP